MLRFLLWRLLAVAAVFGGFALLTWFLRGGPGGLLRGAGSRRPSSVTAELLGAIRGTCASISGIDLRPLRLPAAVLLGAVLLAVLVRWLARRRRRYVRLRVAVYRLDATSVEALVSLYASLHRLLLVSWWRRIFLGQPAVALEVHYEHASQRASGVGSYASFAWPAVCCPPASR